MDTDDIAPPPRAGDLIAVIAAQDLDRLSVAELDARIVQLGREIERTQKRLAQSVNDRASADAIFKR